MGAFVDSVSSILSRVEKRVEVAAQNISNTTTPGFKRGVSFETLAGVSAAGMDSEGLGESGVGAPGPTFALDLTPGQLQLTGNPTDLAIAGNGFFVVRTNSDELLYTRQGQFHRDSDGHLVNGQGSSLQLRGGGELTLKPGDFTILADGTVMQSGEALGRLAIAEFEDTSVVRYAEGGLYSAPASTVSFMADPSVSQGALEASNVSTGVEMMTIMAALRQAQAGQHLMNMYDDLMGRAVTTFGQG